MRNVEIKGIGTSLPQNKIEINGQVRYRVENNEKENQLNTQMDICIIEMWKTLISCSTVMVL